MDENLVSKFTINSQGTDIDVKIKDEDARNLIAQEISDRSKLIKADENNNTVIETPNKLIEHAQNKEVNVTNSAENITGDKEINTNGTLYVNTKNPVKYAEVITNNDNADVINMTDKNNNNYQLLVASGEFYANGKRKLTAKEYGAKGDGVTDDTAILQSILDSGEPLILTKGTYYTSKGLNATNGNVIIGDKGNSVIECHNTENTIDNYIIGTSSRSTIYGVTLRYADDVTILESWPSFSFIGVRFLNTPWGGQRTNGISDSIIVHTGTGILAAPEEVIFSVGFFNLEITEFRNYGMYLCGSSGCTIQNVYINNGVDNAGTQTAKLKKAFVNLVIKDTDCMNIGGLNLEWNNGTALELINSTCFISTLHMEALETQAPYTGYINITNSNLHIGTLSVYYCFTNEIAGTSVIKLNEGNTPTTFDNYHGTDCSLTIDTLLLVGWGSPDWHTFPNATRGLDKATDAKIIFRNNNVGNYNVSINSILRVGVSQADYDALTSKATQYYNQGTGKLYVNKWGEYNKIGVSTDKPSASNPNLYNGATYYNTDTNVTSVYYNDAWLN